MTNTTTQSEVLMAAAVAAQNEATASRAVADSLKVDSLANPQDADLAASALVKEAEALKDQENADKALSEALNAESQEKLTAEIVEPIVIAPQVTPEVVQAEVSKPVVQSLGTVEVKETKVVVPAAKVTAPSGTVTSVGKPVVLSGSFSDIVSKIKTNGTVFQRSLVNQLEQYATAMKPNTPVDANTGARYQTNLWRIIQNVLERSGEEFKTCYTLLLAYFEEYKDDVFHERYVFRFAENISMPSDELATYQQMVNLLKLTCSPVGRAQSLRQVDLGRTMRNNISEPARQKVLEFYNA